MPSRQVCPTCCQPINAGRWPPHTVAVKCQCGTEIKEHTVWSIVEGWAVWSFLRGSIVVGLGALLWYLVVFFARESGGDFLQDVLGKAAWKGFLGGVLLAALGACVGLVVSFFLHIGGTSNRDLRKRYTRRYRCSICGFSGRLEPSFDWGDASCPRCNTLLSPSE